MKPNTHDVDQKWNWLRGLHFKNAWRSHLRADVNDIPQPIKEAMDRCDRQCGFLERWKKAWRSGP